MNDSRPSGSPAIRPNATVTIEPSGPRKDDPREHSIHVALQVGSADPRHGDRSHLAGLARKALEGIQSAAGASDERRVTDLTASRRSTKAGAAVVTSVLVGVEVTAFGRGRPTPESVDGLREVLRDDGYRVAVREKRECAEPSCATQVVMDWDRSGEIPSRWHSITVCGSHNYRTCAGCKSTYVLTSINAAGQAPSVHCEVCGLVLVEWGSSKVWTAQLVTRA